MSTSPTSTLHSGLPAAREGLRHVLVQRLATPLTTGLFVISALSGVALLLHLAHAVFHGMHEWLSMLLLVPVALHLLKNWRPLLAYGKRGWLLGPLVVSLLLAVPFALGAAGGGARGGNPAFRASGLLTQARVADLAPILHTTPEALLSDLRRRGYKAGSPDQTLAAIAQDSGKQADEALFALMPAP